MEKSLCELFYYIEKSILKEEKISYFNIEVKDKKKVITISRIIYHLSYYEDMYFSHIIRQALYNEKVILPKFDEEVVNRKFSEEEMYKWFKHFKEERQRNIAIIVANKYKFQKCVFMHFVSGKMSFADVMTEKILRHDKHHQEQLKYILSYINEP